MEFDRSKVYTALNADELKPGSKVFVADNLATLKEYVDSERSMATIKHIANDSQEHRFVVQFDSDPNTCAWGFAYLVSEPELNWIVYVCRGKNHESYLTSCRSDKWEVAQEKHGAKTKLFEGTEDECEKWYTSRGHLTDVIAAWEDGKTIQFLGPVEWEDLEKPSWDPKYEYRIKPEPLKWTDLKIGDIIHEKNGTETRMVTCIDTSNEPDGDGDICHLCLGDWWITDEELENWEKVE